MAITTNLLQRNACTCDIKRHRGLKVKYIEQKVENLLSHTAVAKEEVVSVVDPDNDVLVSVRFFGLVVPLGTAHMVAEHAEGPKRFSVGSAHVVTSHTHPYMWNQWLPKSNTIRPQKAAM
jgi:hypothetical protein